MSIPTTLPCPGCQSLVRATGSSQEGIFFFCPNFDCDYINPHTNDDMVESLSNKLRDDIYFELDFVLSQEEQDRENQLKNEEQKPMPILTENLPLFHPSDSWAQPKFSASKQDSHLTDWSFGGMTFRTMKAKG